MAACDVPERSGEHRGTFAGLKKASRSFDRPPARFPEYRNLSKGMAGADARQSVALSRTAQAKVFAVCVSFTLAIGPQMPMIALGGRQRRCGPAGRMNGSAIGHAAAWLQETDRLETGGNCRQPRHHRFC